MITSVYQNFWLLRKTGRLFIEDRRDFEFDRSTHTGAPQSAWKLAKVKLSSLNLVCKHTAPS